MDVVDVDTPDSADSSYDIESFNEIVPETVMSINVKKPPPSYILAIGIFSHGEMVIDDSGNLIENENFPSGIIIHKQNAGAFGCVTIDDPVNFRRGCKTTFLAINSLQKSISVHFKGSYNVYVRNTEFNELPLHSSTNTCQLFTDKKRYYEKEYTADNSEKNIILSFYKLSYKKVICINLFNCSTENLQSCLFEIFNPINIKLQIKDVCTKFCDERGNDEIDTRKITTSNLFMLIDFIKKIRENIRQVNILDVSCNVVPATILDRFLKKPNIFDGCTHPNFCCPPNKDFGWGGKRKTKSRKRKSKTLKKILKDLT